MSRVIEWKKRVDSYINGYPKYAIWRTFDAIEVTLKDEEGSVKANQCVLRLVSRLWSMRTRRKRRN